MTGPASWWRDVTRALNIATRTAHLAAMGILLGGHAFDVSPEGLKPILWLTVGTGVVLAVLESRFHLSWVHEARGVLIVVKSAMICLIPFAWEYRVPILLVVTVLGSVGSHMPRRFRHYSIVYRRVIPEACGWGGGSRTVDKKEVAR
jgi:hypothetical protein